MQFLTISKYLSFYNNVNIVKASKHANIKNIHAYHQTLQIYMRNRIEYSINTLTSHVYICILFAFLHCNFNSMMIMTQLANRRTDRQFVRTAFV